MTSPKPRSRATIREVAERAGVSISTVSHALSGRRPISDATKERIHQAIDELGYQPSPSAQMLRTGRANMIGFILRPRAATQGDPSGSETFNRLSGSVAIEMLRRNVGLVHVPNLENPDTAGVPMDGCIVAHPHGSDLVLTELERQGMPLVTIDEDPDRPDRGWAVLLDTAGSVHTLLQHLAERGAENVMALIGSDDNAWMRRATETYHSWCMATGRTPRTLSVDVGASGDDVVTQLRPILEAQDRPDALVVPASDHAARIAALAGELGLSIPGDLMIVALTDTEHSRTATPPITAMDLQHEKLALAATTLILKRLNGESEPQSPPVVHPQITFRESSARS